MLLTRPSPRSFRQLSSSTPQKQDGKFAYELYDYSTVGLYNFQRHGAKHVDFALQCLWEGLKILEGT